MKSDLDGQGEVLTAHFAAKKAATLAASELFEMGISSGDLHITFDGAARGEPAATAPATSRLRHLLDHSHANPTHAADPRAETADKRFTEPAEIEGSGATLILTNRHPSAQVLAILDQHGAELA